MAQHFLKEMGIGEPGSGSPPSLLTSDISDIGVLPGFRTSRLASLVIIILSLN